MSPQKKRAMPSFKIMAAILILLVVGGYSLGWLVEGPLLYLEGQIDTVATVVKPEGTFESEGKLVFALSYRECTHIKEHIVLGTKSLDEAKVPQRLKDIRKCLLSLAPGSTVPVILDTREHRLSGKKHWRVRGVATCEIPHLPSELSVQSGSGSAKRCGFM